MNRLLIALLGVAACPFVMAGFVFYFVAESFSLGRKVFEGVCARVLAEPSIQKYRTTTTP
jgi:hypothetical protein